MWHLKLYSKPRCPLCSAVREAIRLFAQEQAVELEEIDISAVPSLWKKYCYDIPVLEAEGKEVARHYIGVPKLRALHRRFVEEPGAAEPEAELFPARHLGVSL